MFPGSALLASIDLDVGVDAIKTGAATNGRLIDATEEGIQTAIATVGGALAHPILRRAAASAHKGRLRREAPVLLTLDYGSILGDTVDLALRQRLPPAERLSGITCSRRPRCAPTVTR
jgi:hypothetical protein